MCLRCGAGWLLVSTGLAGEAPAAPIEPVPADTAATVEPDGQYWFGKRVVWDLGYVVSDPWRWDGTDWAIASGCVGGTVMLGVFLDGPVQRESQEHPSQALDLASRRVGKLGTIGSFAVIAGTGLTALATKDERLGDATVDALEASIISGGVITPLLKHLVGRTRPRAAIQDSDSGSLFTGGQSFPSGHATQAFTVASVYAESYPDHPWVAVVGYTGATAVAVSRIFENAHYLSDVVAGAVIGTFVGVTTVRLNEARRHPGERHSAFVPAEIGLTTVVEGPALGVTWRW
jgi:membrane-associated phospholipid phosphatase